MREISVVERPHVHPASAAGARANLPARVVVKRKPGKIVKVEPPVAGVAGGDSAGKASPDKPPKTNAEDSDVEYSDDDHEGTEDYKKGGYHPVKVRAGPPPRGEARAPAVAADSARNSSPDTSSPNSHNPANPSAGTKDATAATPSRDSQDVRH